MRIFMRFFDCFEQCKCYNYGHVEVTNFNEYILQSFGVVYEL